MHDATVIVGSSALVALLDPREEHAKWAKREFGQLPAPWLTCEAVLTEAFYLLGPTGHRRLKELLRAEVLVLQFNLAAELPAVLALMDKYADVPMSLADACLVRMTEMVPQPRLLTTDTDFKIYRRHSRLVVPSILP